MEWWLDWFNQNDTNKDDNDTLTRMVCLNGYDGCAYICNWGLLLCCWHNYNGRNYTEQGLNNATAIILTQCGTTCHNSKVYNYRNACAQSLHVDDDYFFFMQNHENCFWMFYKRIALITTSKMNLGYATFLTLLSLITTKFCTCPNSIAVGTCAKFWWWYNDCILKYRKTCFCKIRREICITFVRLPQMLLRSTLGPILSGIMVWTQLLALRHIPPRAGAWVLIIMLQSPPITITLKNWHQKDAISDLNIVQHASVEGILEPLTGSKNCFVQDCCRQQNICCCMAD